MRFEFSDLHIYRRHLPHWRTDHAVYFVTWRLHSTRHLLSPRERSIISDAIEHFHRERYHLIAYVVTDDHVHVFVSLAEGHTLEKIVHSWKSYSAHKLRQDTAHSQAIWQEEYFDRIIRDEKELQRAMQYVANNPAKRWPEIKEYEWLRFFEFEV